MKLPKPTGVVHNHQFRPFRVKFRGTYFKRQMRRMRKGL